MGEGKLHLVLIIGISNAGVKLIYSLIIQRRGGGTGLFIHPPPLWKTVSSFLMGLPTDMLPYLVDISFLLYAKLGWSNFNFQIPRAEKTSANDTWHTPPLFFVWKISLFLPNTFFNWLTPLPLYFFLLEFLWTDCPTHSFSSSFLCSSTLVSGALISYDNFLKGQKEKSDTGCWEH